MGRKQKLFISQVSVFDLRIQEAVNDHLPIIDVDGTFLYKKQQRLLTSGVPAAVPFGPPRVPSSPLTGWEVITRDNVKDIAPRCPVVTSGMPETF